MIVFLSYFIPIVLFWALAHFIYRSVILPTIHTHFRYKLFALRDNLRRLRLSSNTDELSEFAFFEQQRIINNALLLIPVFDFYLFVNVNDWRKEDSEIDESIRNSEKRLKGARKNNEEFRLICKDLDKIMGDVLVFNSLAAIVDLTPIVLLDIISRRITTIARNTIVDRKNLLIPAALNESDIDKFQARRAHHSIA